MITSGGAWFSQRYVNVFLSAQQTRAERFEHAATSIAHNTDDFHMSLWHSAVFFNT